VYYLYDISTKQQQQVGVLIACLDTAYMCMGHDVDCAIPEHSNIMNNISEVCIIIINHNSGYNFLDDNGGSIDYIKLSPNIDLKSFQKIAMEFIIYIILELYP